MFVLIERVASPTWRIFRRTNHERFRFFDNISKMIRNEEKKIRKEKFSVSHIIVVSLPSSFRIAIFTSRTANNNQSACNIKHKGF